MITLNTSNVTFKEDTHTYTDPNGKILISVTTLISKYGLGPDYSKVFSLRNGAEIMNKAAERGTAVHKLIEEYDNTGKIPDIDPESQLILDLSTYIGLMNDKGLKPIQSEYLVANDILAGSIDKVLEDGSIGDIKTCSTMSVDDAQKYRWQLSFYSYLLRKMNPEAEVPHLYIFWVRGASGKVIEVPPIQDEELERILEWERNGYDPSQFELGDVQSKEVDPELNAKMKDYVAIQLRITAYKEMIKALEAQADEIGLLEYMMQTDNSFGEAEGYRLTVVKPTTRSSVDAKDLQKNYPDIYSEVLKTTTVKASLKMTEIKNK